MKKSWIVFLLVNFAALALGGNFTGEGVPSEWYGDLRKAPWTPPGWVFGFAWTTIMIFFAFYMAKLWSQSEDKKTIILLYSIQWILNFGWNPTFFYFHQTGWALLIISALLLVVFYFGIKYYPLVKNFTLLILPYFLWLCIATSLNAYIYLVNFR